MADGKIDTLDVGALERSVNDSATRVSAIWLSFVAFSAYLAAAASNISHRQLFLEDPIKLPTINIDLPLVASAILLPLLFVIYHIYVLVQVVLLARTAQAYNEAIDHAAPDAADSIRVRQRLANTLFAQLFAGSPREREGVLGWLLRAMTWLTLAIGPVFVLIVFEIRFLPYHSALVTWTHRGLITLDLLAILLLWAGAVDVRRDIALRSLVHDWKTALGAAVIVVLSCVAVAFPGEPSRFWTPYLGTSRYSEGDVAECRIPWLFGVAGVGYDRLVLRGEDFVDDDKLKRITDVAAANGQKAYGSERTRVFRGRDLRCGRFSGSDLRHVDFSEADLSGAILRGAHLEGATFPGAKLNGAILDGAQLQEAFFGTSSELAEARVARPKSKGDEDDGDTSVAPPEPSDTPLSQAELQKAILQNAQLRGAHLKGANLEGANLLSAQMQNANLDNVNLRGASLKNATMTGASLNAARLQASSFQLAIMRGVSLDYAQLQGASLQSAHMQGASFDNAKLHGALLYGTYLQGASFRRTELQGAVFRDSKMEGTSFIEAQLQGARFERMQLRYAVVANSYLWGAGPVQCDATYVSEPNLDSIVHVQFTRDNPIVIAAQGKSINDFINDSLQDVPESSAGMPNFSKSKLRDEMVVRLRGAVSGGTPQATAWKKCIDDSQSRAEKGFGDLTPRILRYVCGPAADRNQIVGAVLNAWTSGKLSDTPVAKAIATSLLEPDEKCPGALTLNEATKNRLRYVINPGE